MAIYGRIGADNKVLEICDGDPTSRFHPDIAGAFVGLPDNAAPGDTYENDTLTKYVAPAVETVDPMDPDPSLSLPEFNTRLTRSERIAIKNLRSTNASLDDLMTMIESVGLHLSDADDKSLLRGLIPDTISQASFDAIYAIDG